MPSQRVEYSMHCVNYAKREQGKPLLFKLTLRSRSTLSQSRSDTCHELLVVFGLSTLNSNRTNYKPRKKLANQKHRHMSLRLCEIRTRYCALIRRRSIHKVESVCDAGNILRGVQSNRCRLSSTFELFVFLHLRKKKFDILHSKQILSKDYIFLLCSV